MKSTIPKNVVFDNFSDKILLSFDDYDFFKPLFFYDDDFKISYSKSKVPIGIKRDGKPFYLDLSETFRAVITGRTRTGKTFFMRAMADRIKKSGFYHTFFLPDTKNEFFSSYKPVQEKFRSFLLKGEVPSGIKILGLRPSIFKKVDFGVPPPGSVYFSMGLEELSRNDFLILLDYKNKTGKQKNLLNQLYDKIEDFKEKGNVVDFEVILSFLDEIADEDDKNAESILSLKTYFKTLISSNFVDKEHFIDIIRLMEEEDFSFSLNVINFEFLKVSNIINLFFMSVLSKLVNARKNADKMKLKGFKQGFLSKPLFIFIDEAPRFIPEGDEPVGKHFVMESVDLDTRFGIYYIFATQQLNKIPEPIISQSRYIFVPYNSPVVEFSYIMKKGGFASNVQVASNEAISLKNSLNKFEWVCFDMNERVYTVFRSLAPLSFHIETNN